MLNRAKGLSQCVGLREWSYTAKAIYCILCLGSESHSKSNRC